MKRRNDTDHTRRSKKEKWKIEQILKKRRRRRRRSAKRQTHQCNTINGTTTVVGGLGTDECVNQAAITFTTKKEKAP